MAGEYSPARCEREAQYGWLRSTSRLAACFDFTVLPTQPMTCGWGVVPGHECTQNGRRAWLENISGAIASLGSIPR